MLWEVACSIPRGRGPSKGCHGVRHCIVLLQAKVRAAEAEFARWTTVQDGDEVGVGTLVSSPPACDFCSHGTADELHLYVQQPSQPTCLRLTKRAQLEYVQFGDCTRLRGVPARVLFLGVTSTFSCPYCMMFVRLYCLYCTQAEHEAGAREGAAAVGEGGAEVLETVATAEEASALQAEEAARWVLG